MISRRLVDWPGARAVALTVLLAAATFLGSLAHAGERPRQVLLLTHNTFYNHDNLATIEAVLPEWGKTAGFVVTSLEGYKQTQSCSMTTVCDPAVAHLGMIDRAYLSRFDAIVTSTNGELPFTDEGRQALVDFVAKDGKAIIFLHQSAVTLYGFRPWGEMLGGYLGDNPTFDGRNAHKRRAVMRIEDRSHPASRRLPRDWVLDDEFYRFARKGWDPAAPEENLGPTKLPVPFGFSRKRVHVLVSLDSRKTDMSGAKGWEVGGDYPQVWWRRFGKGKTFYTAIGHRADLWSDDPVFRAFITSAIRWGVGLEK